MTTLTSKSIILKENIHEGIPLPEHFHIEEKIFPLDETISNLKEGEIVLEAKAFSVDPYLRNRVRVVQAGSVLNGYVAGRVLASKNPLWKVGDLLGSQIPYSTYQVLSESQVSEDKTWKLTEWITDDEFVTRGVGILGSTGATAYGGLIDILQPKKGETIFVSAASGAVGGLVGMIAKHVFGCKVIGSCGGPEKTAFIKDYYGFDHAIDYKKMETKEDLIAALREVAPEGIDMYFENVGGIHFEAAMATLRKGGRIAICGWISQYHEKGFGGANIAQFSPLSMIYSEQRIQGFHCSHWLYGEKGNFLEDMSRWLKEDKVKAQETVYQGIESWPGAFHSLFLGGGKGKNVVRI